MVELRYLQQNKVLISNEDDTESRHGKDKEQEEGSFPWWIFDIIFIIVSFCGPDKYETILKSPNQIKIDLFDFFSSLPITIEAIKFNASLECCPLLCVIPAPWLDLAGWTENYAVKHQIRYRKFVIFPAKLIESHPLGINFYAQNIWWIIITIIAVVGVQFRSSALHLCRWSNYICCALRKDVGDGGCCRWWWKWTDFVFKIGN